jgi:hypothetical protein
MWVMTDRSWERVEAVRVRLRSYFGALEFYDDVSRSIFGQWPLHERPEPEAFAAWWLAHLAFLGEWHSRETLEGLLDGNGHNLGLSTAEITSGFDRVLEIVERVGPARAGSE